MGRWFRTEGARAVYGLRQPLFPDNQRSRHGDWGLNGMCETQRRVAIEGI